MDAKVLIDIHRKALKDAEGNGLTSVSSKNLHSIFDQIEKGLEDNNSQIDPVSLEKFRSDLAASVAYHDHVHNWDIEGFKQVIALGQSALKSIMLINGGASVALLAFISNLATNASAKLPIPPFAESLRYFVIGVFLASAAFATTYLSQSFFDGEKEWQQRTGLTFQIITIAIGIFSFVSFFYGADAAYHAFLGIAP